jgi:hypothetical protein
MGSVINWLPAAQTKTRRQRFSSQRASPCGNVELKWISSAPTPPPAQFFDHAQTLPKHRHAVKDYFPISEIFDDLGEGNNPSPTKSKT